MKKLIFVIVPLMLLIACAPSAEEKSAKEKVKQDSIAAVYEEAPPPESASTEGNVSKEEVEQQNKPTAVKKQQPIWDSAFIKRNADRKLIKTVNLECKVAEVEKATYQIENITKQFGGFITSSDITNSNYSYNEYRISKDSVKVVGIRNIENNITLRVPNFYLDSVLYHFSKIWTQLDHRTLKVEDVTIQLLSNELRARLYQKTASKINDASAQPKNKLNDVVEAEKTAADYLESTINKKIENLTLQDRIDYSDITLHMYQDKVLYKTTIASVDPEQYEPGFGNEFVDSLQFGWKIFVGFLLFLTKCWSVIVISLMLYVVVYFTIRFFIHRSRKNKNKPKGE
jgi:hypothetical protein